METSEIKPEFMQLKFTYFVFCCKEKNHFFEFCSFCRKNTLASKTMAKSTQYV